ncbi:MAG: translation initiation factor [Verrucomicrobia bacterium]|nr:translation initiation factor [Verrucomicrobiota bacterium]
MTKARQPTDGGASLSQSPFDKLAAPAAAVGAASATGAKAAGVPAAPAPVSRAEPVRNRGRVDVRRSTAGRGGKTVTIVQGFVGIGLPEKEELARRMQRRCGTGGTVKEGRIEIQGDQRDAVIEILEAAGFRPVRAGG